MRLRRILKRWIYTSVPGLSGRFPYFETSVYFPESSATFDAVCANGIYEAQNTHVLVRLVRPNSTAFDVGSHLGLLAIPMLKANPSVKVISFEPSPNVLPYLRKTIEKSSYSDRWTVVGKAVSDNASFARFSCCGTGDELYDGLMATGRAEVAKIIEMETTTLDLEWKSSGCPDVSLIKIDVEGAELLVLQGAKECLNSCRPNILVEWQPLNLSTYGFSCDELLRWANDNSYILLSGASFSAIREPEELKTIAMLNESFILTPRSI